VKKQPVIHVKRLIYRKEQLKKKIIKNSPSAIFFMLVKLKFRKNSTHIF